MELYILVLPKTKEIRGLFDSLEKVQQVIDDSGENPKLFEAYKMYVNKPTDIYLEWTIEKEEEALGLEDQIINFADELMTHELDQMLQIQSDSDSNK